MYLLPMSDSQAEATPNMPDPATAVTAALVKNVDSKFLSMFYKDALQPGVQQVGKALSDVMGLGNTVLLPIKMLNDKAKTLYERHMEQYRKNLENVPQEDIVEVAPEIGVPVMEKLEKTTNKKLSDLYINLLTNASIISNVNDVHPRYISIIENITPDEIVILNDIFNEMHIPAISIRVKIKRILNTPLVKTSLNEAGGNILKGGTSYAYTDSIINKGAIKLYFQNLIGLGLINYVEGHMLHDLMDNGNSKYEKLEEYYKDEYNIWFSMENTKAKIIRTKYGITELGKSFVRACKKGDE